MPTHESDEQELLVQLTKKMHRILSEKPFQPEKLKTLLANQPDYMLAMLLNAPYTYTAKVFGALEEPAKLSVLGKINTHTLQTVLKAIKDEELIHLISISHPTVRNRMVKQLDHLRASTLQDNIGQQIVEKINQSVNYPKRSVGRLMETDQLELLHTATIGEARTLVDSQGQFHTPTTQLYIIDSDRKFKGVVPILALFGVPAKDSIHQYMLSGVPTLRARTPQETAAEVFQGYGVSEIPVLESDRLIGRVLVESMFDVIQEEHIRQMQRIAGISGADEALNTPALQASKRRLPWMIVNIFLDLIAVSAIMPFEATIAQVTALAVLMPIISDMGGNIGIQALTVSIRSLQHSKIGWRLPFMELRKEILVGITNGVVLGIIIAIIGFLGWGNPYLGLVVGISMFINTIMASVVGGILPILLKKIKLDPALMSGAILTTITDFTGFLIFLGLATMFLQQLTG